MTVSSNMLRKTAGSSCNSIVDRQDKHQDTYERGQDPEYQSYRSRLSFVSCFLGIYCLNDTSFSLLLIISAEGGSAGCFREKDQASSTLGICLNSCHKNARDMTTVTRSVIG